MSKCDLCELRDYTQRYCEFSYPFKFTILDCDSCDTPMGARGASAGGHGRRKEVDGGGSLGGGGGEMGSGRVFYRRCDAPDSRPLPYPCSSHLAYALSCARILSFSWLSRKKCRFVLNWPHVCDIGVRCYPFGAIFNNGAQRWGF